MINEKFKQRLESLVKNIGSQFTLKGRLLTPSEIMSDTGMLPGLTKRADQLASLCLGYGLGATYEDQEKALLGKKVNFDEFTPNVLRIFCIADVLFEMIRNAPSKDTVSLDELMYD